MITKRKKRTDLVLHCARVCVCACAALKPKSIAFLNVHFFQTFTNLCNLGIISYCLSVQTVFHPPFSNTPESATPSHPPN